jgi:hypothetical protein
MEEATESAMVHKNKLHRLTSEWDVKQHNKDHIHEENVLEIMEPHSNIRGICIRGHGGANCPKWLGENLSVKNLQSLHLDDVLGKFSTYWRTVAGQQAWRGAFGQHIT